MREAAAAHQSAETHFDPVGWKSPQVYALILAAASCMSATAVSGLGLPDLKDGFPDQISSQAIRQCCQSAFQAAGIEPHDIGYLDVFGSGYDPLDEIEISGLVEAYCQKGSAMTCGIGSTQANLGFSFPTAGLASLIGSALILHHRFIPAVPEWTGPKHLRLWERSPFYVASELADMVL